jgi:hypothetical protein
MAEELDFSNPEHAAGSTMAAFALAQISFSTLVTNGLILEADAEHMLKQLIKANETGRPCLSSCCGVTHNRFAKRVRISAGNAPIAGAPKRHQRQRKRERKAARS